MLDIKCSCRNPHCKCNCHLIKVLANLLEAAREIDTKRLILEELLDAESEAFFPVQDKLSVVGAEILGIELDSVEGDFYTTAFFDYVFGKLDLNESIEKLLAI
jgi:hypothetical protein